MARLEPQQLFDNRYELIQQIGVGGFSEVWKVRDTIAENTLLALKVFAPGNGLDTVGNSLFRKEYALTANLRHPNLLKANHFSVCDGAPYLTMPFCERGSLGKLLMEHGTPMSLDEILKLLEQIAGALAYLHSRDPQIMHQDIKPDNVLIDSDGEFLLADFGISNQLRNTIRKSTGASQSLTVAYAPPERFESRPRSLSASDVFSLGVMIYECVTGDVPWMGQGGLALLSGAQVPALPEDQPEPLNLLTQACLALNPDNRPSAEAIARWARNARESGQFPPVPGPAAALSPPAGRPTQVITPTAGQPSGFPPPANPTVQMPAGGFGAASHTPAGGGSHTQVMPAGGFAVPAHTPGGGMPGGFAASPPPPAAPAPKKNPALVIGLVVLVLLLAGGGIYWAVGGGGKSTGDTPADTTAIAQSPTDVEPVRVEQLAPGPDTAQAQPAAVAPAANAPAAAPAAPTKPKLKPVARLYQPSNCASMAINLKATRARALFDAVNQDNTTLAEELIGNCADLNWKNVALNDQTALFVAVAHQHTPITRLLISYGANVNAQDDSKDTPLHHAAKAGSTTMVQLLIDNGANLNLRDAAGFTPLGLAQKHGRTAVADLLKMYGAS